MKYNASRTLRLAASDTGNPSSTWEEDSASLYNSAHQIAALTTFTELATTSAYSYLKIDRELAQDMTLLIPAYNHFVHYLQYNRYKREQKEKGKASQEAAKKKFNKNRERLRNERRDFAIINKFPKQYRDILEPITAHSNDEKVEGKGFYKIKTLPYRSNNTNRFFRRLDIMMKNAAEQDPIAKSSRRRVRRLPKNPEMSSYKIAPKGLPIDFYHPKWYHNLVPAQQQSIPNQKALAFLPDANESLLPKDDDEAAEEEQGGNDDDEGEGIDLTQPSPDNSDDEFHVEGDAGDLYEEEDDGFVVNDGEEQDGSDDDDDDYDKAEDGGVKEDCQMDDIPECEEDW
ncbi:uncharacterized protein PGTG_21597 [Puccinia graminis f. sp. tritici CRL 75-36-700-3]|uniref:Uncharacterized protein n=1 Tax=Puccinia graminis f. sp. tritici (strain CRL 75-36-700-3 / race SCCL) TaxID=418459 RepID=H6QRY2_PUCGT|nr:uncharacterized protein PGTG_21597 [Puccinia graminis f. sp. tritici CRL 75-36-700-3]EHS63466.1 hypothetical protein PGTG_21597 [Puccinia graminis f. sp. tritici CRL 75-36-700-3]